MRLLKPFLYGVLLILGLYLLIGLFLPDTVEISRSIVVNEPPQQAFNYVANMRNWQEWSPWAKMDSTAQHEVSAATRGRGAYWAWQGQQIGTGRLTRESEDSPNRLESRLEFYSPMEATAQDIWVFEAVPEGTAVTWIYRQELGYPTERYLGLFTEKMLAPSLENGLQNLKAAIENRP